MTEYRPHPGDLWVQLAGGSESLDSADAVAAVGSFDSNLQYARIGEVVRPRSDQPPVCDQRGWVLVRLWPFIRDNKRAAELVPTVSSVVLAVDRIDAVPDVTPSPSGLEPGVSGEYILRDDVARAVAASQDAGFAGIVVGEVATYAHRSSVPTWYGPPRALVLCIPDDLVVTQEMFDRLAAAVGSSPDANAGELFDYFGAGSVLVNDGRIRLIEIKRSVSNGLGQTAFTHASIGEPDVHIVHLAGRSDPVEIRVANLEATLRMLPVRHDVLYNGLPTPEDYSAFRDLAAQLGSRPWQTENTALWARQRSGIGNDTVG